jgi:SAM domain (Sterile alpha motif)
MQLPSLTKIQGLNTKQLTDYLQRELEGLDADDLEILTKNKIDGETFLDLTQEELERWGMTLGPAKEIVKYIAQLKGIRK